MCAKVYFWFKREGGFFKICLMALSFYVLELTSPVHASALQKMFESLGGSANVTTPGGFQDQAAGYYTGGGVMMRHQNKAVQPLNISLPKMGMGCGGIDMYFGSLSAIKGEEMVQLLRTMGTQVPTYAFQLALKTMAPQLENLMVQIRKYVQDMNSLMLDSCQMSQNIVGGLMPTGAAASELICQDSLRSGGEDWFGARKHCRDEKKVSHKVGESRRTSPDLLQGEYNLTWYVLKKMPGYGEDKDWAQFILTTVGTLISRQEPDGRFKIHTLEGKGDQKGYLASYLKGGRVSRYVCNDDQQCLHPMLREIDIKDEGDNPQALKAKTARKIKDLWTKYIHNTPITETERSFLSDTANLPVYRYIQVSAAVGSPFIMNDTSEYIAVSVLLTQFDKISAEILSALDTLQSVQLESQTIDRFKRSLQTMRSRLQTLSASVDGAAIWRLNQAIQAHEQALAARNN